MHRACPRAPAIAAPRSMRRWRCPALSENAGATRRAMHSPASALHRRRGALDRRTHAWMAAAAAEIPDAVDVAVRRFGFARQQIGRGDQHARLAISAEDRILVDPGLLQWV